MPKRQSSRRRTTNRKGGKRRSLTGKLLCTPEFFVPSFERHFSGKKSKTRSHCRMSRKSQMKSKIAKRTNIVRNVSGGRRRKRTRRRTQK